MSEQDVPRKSNFTDAVQRMEEASLQCVKCFALNRPGVFLIRFEQNGTASCSVCGTNFTPPEPKP